MFLGIFKKKDSNNNDSAKKAVIDFIEGRIEPKEFLDMCQNDGIIYDWIQSIVPKKKTCYKRTIYKHTDRNGSIHMQANSEVVPYDIRLIVTQHLDAGGSVLEKHMNIHNAISTLIKEVFPNEIINISDKLEKQFVFMLDACPSYIGGDEVDRSGILEKLFCEIPENFTESQAIKWYKEQVKTLFCIQGNKPPQWLQAPEWPISGGKPMRFVSQKHDKNHICEYLFEDVDTGEIRVIKQFT